MFTAPKPVWYAILSSLWIAGSSTASTLEDSIISVEQSKRALRTIQTERAISNFLADVARRAVVRVSAEGFSLDDLAISLIIMKPNQPPKIGGYNDKTNFYPASVVKIPYAIALEKQFQDGRLKEEKEILYDLHDMLRRSSNAATNRILDRLTQTQSGPELSPAELEAFAEKRQEVNRYLKSLGFSQTNAVQKTWDDWPYGRDLQYIGEDWSNRNQMTTKETAEMLWLIGSEKVVSPKACQRILQSMKRTPGNPKDIQSNRIGSGIPPTSSLWSKAGWTSETNHDAAWVDLPIGGSFVLVVFTNANPREQELMRFIAEEVTSGIQLNRIFPKQGIAQPGKLLIRSLEAR